MCDLDTPLLIVLVYRPPSRKNFISQFSDFLSNTVSNHDRILIVGDFNIHVCCPSKPMVSDFLHLIDSFGLAQHVTDSTHRLGHTLDLVLTSGFPVSNVNTLNACSSDHLAVVFTLSLSLPSPASPPPVCLSRNINTSTASKFSSAFLVAPNISTIVAPPSHLNTEELTSLFNSACLSALDSVAPLRKKKPKPKGQPWLNDNTRAQRKEYRKAERKWKHDRLHVSLEMLRDSRINYQAAVKASRVTYFSGLINSSHNPRTLFTTINSLINPPRSTHLDVSPTKCEEFLVFFHHQS